MILLAFKVEHFRCLHSTDWIPFSGLSIFTGENDGGKSTTLYALEVFLNPRKNPLPDDFSYITFTAGSPGENKRETTITLWAKFELQEPESLILKAVWGFDGKIVEVKRIFQVDVPSPSYLFIAQAYDDDAFKRPLDDYTILQLKEIAEKFSINLGIAKLKQEIISAIRNWLATQPQKPSEVKLPDDLVACLPEIQVFSSESALDPENEIRRTLS
ncbi:MAG: AAA family ATPase, partial [Thermoplasmata archaeon]|nr:AAA family ATPase [Thermoplasmata archaeon]